MDWTSPYRAPFALLGHGNLLYNDPPSRTCSNLFIVKKYGSQVGALHLSEMRSCLLLLTNFISKRVLDYSTKRDGILGRYSEEYSGSTQARSPYGLHEKFQFGVEGGGIG